MHSVETREPKIAKGPRRNQLKSEIFQTRVAYVIEDEDLLHKEFTHHGIRFSCVTFDNAIASFNDRRPEIILVTSNLIDRFATNLDQLRAYSTSNDIPLVLYSQQFEKLAQNIARTYHFDDYHFGAISRKFVKQIYFLKKLKNYKSKRKNNFASKYQWHGMQLWFLAKRLFDITASSAVLLLTSPLLLFIALIVKLESRGPVFYISKRAGSGYRVFDFYKFRSMRQGADTELQQLLKHNQYGNTFFKMKDDPRITRFGGFLRSTSLDELPQLFNVLKGDMSLIGNRPLPLYEAEQLTKDTTAERFLAPAGITGLWQIIKRGREEMSEKERIDLDVEYARKCSLGFDLKIFFKTFPALMQKTSV
ncbi:MAG TPA: sugar transferase [Cyclobacteriaceae bacterium]|nr:sugar transferase [Cyclobacteriaceae bacterium]